jgi:hypothetical protein
MRTTVLAAAAAALIPIAAVAQQKPIYGCRQAINCRPSPTSNSALADPAVGGLLIGGGIQWGPGFHMGLVMPALKLPLIGKETTYEVKDFHLHNATLLPPPEPTAPPDAAAAPAVTPTPAPR